MDRQAPGAAFRRSPAGRLIRRVRRFAAERSGAIAVMFALALPVMIGFTGLALDAGVWFQQHAQIQVAADAAAIAGAREMGAGQSGQVTSVAQASAGLNGFTSAAGAQVQVSTSGSTVTAAVTAPAPLYFSQLFLPKTFKISAQASASFTNTPYCIEALDPVGIATVASGNASLVANGCSIQVNSSGNPAIESSGNAYFTAQSICVTGTYGSGIYTPTPQSHCPARPDPLAYLPPPTFGSTCLKTNYAVSSTPPPLSQGVYCGGITASGSAALTLQPGTYILKDGGLKLSGQTSLTGSGVMIYLTGNAPSIAMSGGVSVHLSAMTSGTYAGILIFGDRSVSNGSAAFSGGNNSYYEGTVYLPTMNVALSGSSSGTTSSPWSAFIANTITLSGNGSFTVNSNYASSQVPPPPGLFQTVATLTN